MKKISFIIITASCFVITACSVPASARRQEIYSFSKLEKKPRGVFGKKKDVSIQDFRERVMYDEDIIALKEEVEKYISAHPDLTQGIKDSLRQIRVAEGENKEEVALLLGEPDKIEKLGRAAPYAATEKWIYSINKLRAFTIFIVPVAFVHEAYYLYFKNDTLAGIERHYLKQMIKQDITAPGVPTKN